MKSLFIAIALFTTVAANAANPSVNENVLKTFNENFKDAENIAWVINEDVVTANFTLNAVNTKAMLDKKGNLLQTIRYYKAELPVAITKSLSYEFGKKEIKGVTEVTNANGVFYFINLMDNKRYYQVVADAEGNVSLQKTLKRGDL